MPLLLRISLILLFALAIKYLHSLLTNYLSARATGLKIIVSPLDPYGSICQILRALCDPFMRRFRWYRVIEPTCSFRDGDRWHRVLGSSFVVVSASRCIIYTNDPVAIEGNLRGKDIVKPKLYENLDIYGKNVDTVNGDEWARHRKLTAPCFNERISDIVWEETMRQVEAMVSHWYSQPGNKTNTIVKDVRIMALHVLFSAGFGVSHDFHTGARVVASGREMSHATSLRTILQNIMTSVIVSQVSWLDSKAVKPMLSERVRKVLVAFKEFGQYMDEMIANERVLMAGRPESAKPNLISTMIQMSDKAKEQKAEADQLTPKLTDGEIKGNLFIFNLAGHDTSSNTLVFAIALLSIHQDVQQWVMEELNEVLGTEETLAYEKVYPRLKRVTALMYETLRRYGPVITQPRAPRVPGTTIRITDPNEPSNTKTITIPPNTEVAHNFHACHTSATNFDDPLTFNPKRWIQPASSLADEKIVPPGRGFYAWSFGPRICLGMKFSQVEFAAAIVVMLKNFRLYPSSKMDMDEATAREELNEILGRSVSGVTLGLEKPEEMYIRLAKR